MLGVLARAQRSGGGGLAALARNRRIMVSSALGALPLAVGSPAPFSMLQMSCRGSRRSRFYGQNAELASYDCGASEGGSDRRELGVGWLALNLPSDRTVIT